MVNFPAMWLITRGYTYAHEIPQMIIQVESEQWSSAQVGLSETLVPHVPHIFLMIS